MRSDLEIDREEQRLFELIEALRRRWQPLHVRWRYLVDRGGRHALDQARALRRRWEPLHARWKALSVERVKFCLNVDVAGARARLRG